VRSFFILTVSIEEGFKDKDRGDSVPTPLQGFHP